MQKNSGDIKNYLTFEEISVVRFLESLQRENEGQNPDILGPFTNLICKSKFTPLPLFLDTPNIHLFVKMVELELQNLHDSKRTCAKSNLTVKGK